MASQRKQYMYSGGVWRGVGIGHGQKAVDREGKANVFLITPIFCIGATLIKNLGLVDNFI